MNQILSEKAQDCQVKKEDTEFHLKTGIVAQFSQYICEMYEKLAVPQERRMSFALSYPYIFFHFFHILMSTMRRVSH